MDKNLWIHKKKIFDMGPQMWFEEHKLGDA